MILAAMQKFGLDSVGVPFLVIGDTYLMGDVDIPGRFPGVIEQHLAQRGVDWPDILGLHEMLTAAHPTVTPSLLLSTPNVNQTVSPDSSEPGRFTPTPGTFLNGEGPDGSTVNFAHDPLGNSLAVVILLGMAASLIWGTIYFYRSESPVLTILNWAIPALCIVGLGVAGYLAYVEITQVATVCGPVGDCNTIQQSEYAHLFGILPIGVMGMGAYFMIIAAWIVRKCAKGKPADYAALMLLLMTFFGTLFSIYLTFLEPFVIGATCARCLTSAIIMTALMWLSIAPGKLAYNHLVIESGSNDDKMPYLWR